MGRKLSVYMEINGQSIYTGSIEGETPLDACFSYASEYRENPKRRPISLSLPFQPQPFDPIRTKNFFEGLLPEGFTRRCVAGWMHVDENDYLSILAGLGKECLGAIKIVSDTEPAPAPEYRRLTNAEVKKLAQEGATESAQLVTKAHLSLTGASGKVGLYYHEPTNQWYLPIGEAPSTHIVKQSHVRLQNLVVNEQLCLLTAQNLGLEVPDSFIVRTDGFSDGDVLFATRRYDRPFIFQNYDLHGLPLPCRLHQEDFAQALGIAASDKYEKGPEHYLLRMFELLRTYSADPIADQMKLWEICIFNYLIGNTDNHIKNLSLLYGADFQTIRLAPAYDMISTVIYESSTEDMALHIGGHSSLRAITRQAFQEEAKSIGLGIPLAMRRFDFLATHFEAALLQAETVLMRQGFTQVSALREQILQKGGIRNERK